MFTPELKAQKTMLTPELKARWIRALESGDYPQGVGRLRSARGYCCLGVFCDISGEGAWEPPSDPLSGSYIYRTPSSSSEAVLPSDMIDRLLPMSEMFGLTNLNDMGHSFPKIAQWIRENL